MKQALEFIPPLCDYTVVAIPAIAEMEVDGPDGFQERTVLPAKPVSVDSHMTNLTELYLAVGPGEHAVADATEQLVAAGTTALGTAYFVRRMASALTRLLPIEVFEYEGEGDDARLRLANMAIAMRLPTSDERAAYRARQRQGESERIAAKMAELEAAEAEKTHLTDYDHALVRLAGRSVCLPLESPVAFVAARLLEIVAALPAGTDALIGNELSAAIWERMPIAERRLFVAKDKEIVGREEAIYKMVMNILLRLGPRLGFAQHRVSDAFRLTDSNVVVEYQAIPYEGAYGKDVRVVHAAGVPLADIRVQPESIPEADMAAARTALAHWHAGTAVVGHSEAVALVQMLMTHNGKDALLAALRAEHPGPSYAEAYDNVAKALRELACRSLGFQSYRSTCDELVIGRYSWSHARPVQLVGGELDPAATNAGLGVSRDWIII